MRLQARGFIVQVNDTLVYLCVLRGSLHLCDGNSPRKDAKNRKKRKTWLRA
jgi:hypothetical protein